MNSFQSFVAELGGMHDSIVLHIEVDARNATLVFELEDIYSNFDGLPEYRGITPATIVLAGIERFSMRLQMSIESLTQKLHIHEFVVLEQTDFGELAEIKFWPEGIIQIEYATATVKSAERQLWPIGTIENLTCQP